MIAYSYSLAVDFGGVIDSDLLWSELQASGAGQRVGHWDQVGDVICIHGAFLSGDQAIISAVVSAHSADELDMLKKSHWSSIDSETERRIHSGPGFEWPPSSGQFFSLSQNAQVKWNGMAMAAASPVFVYPVKVRTKDDKIEYSITDAAEVSNMWGVALLTVRAYLDASRTAKTAVEDSTTTAEADAALAAFLAS